MHPRGVSSRLPLKAAAATSPTVVIEQGAGEPSLAWVGLQEEIAQFARVCLYDRAGYQWSDPLAGLRTVEDRVKDLYALLVNAATPGPYVRVAHSYGGFLVRLFARDHRASLAGLVLVDTPDGDVYFTPEVLARYSQIAAMLAAMKFLSRIGLPRLLNRWLASRSVGSPPPMSEQINAGMVRREYFAAAVDDISSLRRAQQRLGARWFRVAGRPAGSSDHTWAAISRTIRHLRKRLASGTRKAGGAVFEQRVSGRRRDEPYDPSG